MSRLAAYSRKISTVLASSAAVVGARNSIFGALAPRLAARAIRFVVPSP
jgi:hypothetical protein